MLKKLLGKLSGKAGAEAEGRAEGSDILKVGETVARASVESRQPVSEGNDSERLITVFDSYGREIRISLEDWKEKVLQPNLQGKWNDANGLYNLIISALNDGLFSDVEEASLRLWEIDTDIERSHTIRGIILLKLGRLTEAAAVLDSAMQQAGRTGTLLTNRAKVLFEQGDNAGAEQMLWSALETDPNMENGLSWWLAIQNERHGQSAYLSALQRTAALPGSWRSQLWLARHHLEAGQLEGALAIYREVLAEGNYMPDALMMISGDLGNNGHEALIIELILPVYDPARHSPQTGFNLLEALIRQRKLELGELLLSRLYALNMSPYKQALDTYANRLQALRDETPLQNSINPADLQIRLLQLDKPLWCYGLEHPQWLFGQKPDTVEKVVFLPFSLPARSGGSPNEQREDDAGRMSRALPIYLAESVYEWSERAALVRLPVVEGGGPVVFGEDDDGVAHCDRLEGDCSYLLTGSIREGSSDGLWQLVVRLWYVATASCVAEKILALNAENCGSAVRELEDWMHRGLGGKRDAPLDAFYWRPTEEAMSPYLSALGQSLTLTLVHNDITPKGIIWGERSMIEYPLRMALHWPHAEHLKIFYLSGIGKAAGYKSDVVHEYAERTLQLLRAAEETDCSFVRLRPLVWKAFGMTDSLKGLQHVDGSDHAYRQWLHAVQADA